MRRTGPRSTAGWLLGAALGLIVPRAVAADDRMDAIVAAVRAEEARYKDIEYVARTTARDERRKDPTNPAEVTMLATRRIVLQGGLTFFQEQAFERAFATKARHQEISAFDGDRTRTVVAGNSANIHLGRFEHPKLCPAHSLPLAHVAVGLPLSVYLGGTEAIHARLGDPPGGPDYWILGGSLTIVPHFEGEEAVDGLRCLKIRVEHWATTKDPPRRQYLWLAPGRNYHCVKEEDPWHEMRVVKLRELAPRLWFPSKISVGKYDIPGALQGQKNVVSRIETSVDTVDLAPGHDLAFFREVAIPADLPVFTIKDWKLTGSTLPKPMDDDRGRAEMAKVAAGVAAQARRYDNLEVKARRVHTSATSNRWNQTTIVTQSREERSILRGDLAYYIAHGATTSLDGSRTKLLQVHAFDGEWTRYIWSQEPSGLGDPAVMIRRGRVKNDPRLLESIFVHRPHSLMLRDHLIFPTLTDLPPF